MTDVELKKEFERRAAEVVVQLNDLETLAAQLVSSVGGMAITVGREIREIRTAVHVTSGKMSAAMAARIM